MEKKSEFGFTLIELLVALAIASILLAVGVPSFGEAIQESQISSQYNTMVRSLYLARSEAVKGPNQVTVCPRKEKGVQECGGVSDWNNGWIVFIDNTYLSSEAQAKIDSADKIISVESAMTGTNVIHAIGSSSNSALDAENVAFVRYTTDGDAEWAAGSFVICDTSRGSKSSRAINIVLTGDIRRGRAASDDEAPRDVFNQPISKYCTESG